ncbi:MAG TPA: hypothetical protein VLA02_08070 [Reyranella sp.]|nr:hypothetical protein [Reyranella sp.]
MTHRSLAAAAATLLVAAASPAPADPAAEILGAGWSAPGRTIATGRRGRSSPSPPT